MITSFSLSHSMLCTHHPTVPCCLFCGFSAIWVKEKEDNRTEMLKLPFSLHYFLAPTLLLLKHRLPLQVYLLNPVLKITQCFTPIVYTSRGISYLFIGVLHTFSYKYWCVCVWGGCSGCSIGARTQLVTSTNHMNIHFLGDSDCDYTDKPKWSNLALLWLDFQPVLSFCLDQVITQGLEIVSVPVSTLAPPSDGVQSAPQAMVPFPLILPSASSQLSLYNSL